MVRRTVSVHFPYWSVDLVRRKLRRRNPDRTKGVSSGPPRPGESLDPILLIKKWSGQEIVAGHCEIAWRGGVRQGMNLAQALAIFPESIAPRERIHIRRFTPERDAASLRALAVWAVRFAPSVAPDEPSGLLLDVTGCEALYGDERRMLARFGAELAALGIRPRVAVAPTFGCAWAMARYATEPLTVVEPDEVRDRMATLPIESLRVDPATVESLAEVGVEDVRQLLALPRKDLGSRFGVDLLLRLDQAFGDALEVITPVRPQEPPRVEKRFRGPTVRHEAITAAVRSLLGELEELLESDDSGVLRFELVLERSDCPPLRIPFALGRPSRDPRHIEALMRPKVEKAQLGFGVEAVILEARSTGELPRSQSVHPSSGIRRERLDEKRALGQLLDTLAGRIGWDRLRRFEAMESHLPERAFRSLSLLEPGAGLGVDGAADQVSAKHATGDPAAEGASDSLRPDECERDAVLLSRPTVLFDRPVPIERMDIDPTGAPSWFRWCGYPYEVISTVGPERISSEWWRSSSGRPRDFKTRDYYRVQEEGGRWLWLFCEGGDEDRSGVWFVHGEWR